MSEPDGDSIARLKRECARRGIAGVDLLREILGSEADLDDVCIRHLTRNAVPHRPFQSMEVSLALMYLPPWPGSPGKWDLTRSSYQVRHFGGERFERETPPFFYPPSRAASTGEGGITPIGGGSGGSGQAIILPGPEREEGFYPPDDGY